MKVFFRYLGWGSIFCFSLTDCVRTDQASSTIDCFAWAGAVECEEMTVFWFSRPWGYLELRIDENYSHRRCVERREMDDRCQLTDNNWSLFRREVTSGEKIVVRITGMGSEEWLGVMERYSIELNWNSSRSLYSFNRKHHLLLLLLLRGHNKNSPFYWPDRKYKAHMSPWCCKENSGTPTMV